MCACVYSCVAVVQPAYLAWHQGGAVCVCVCDAQFFQIMLKLRGSTMMRPNHVCVCVFRGFHQFYQVSRLSLYGHTGVPGSGRPRSVRPTVQARGASLCCPSTSAICTLGQTLACCPRTPLEHGGGGGCVASGHTPTPSHSQTTFRGWGGGGRRKGSGPGEPPVPWKWGGGAVASAGPAPRY